MVDDGSTDGTADVAAALARPGDPVVGHSDRARTAGRARRCGTGMLAARFDHVLFTDVDLSTPIEDAAKLRAVLVRGADVGDRVATSRRIRHSGASAVASGSRRAAPSAGSCRCCCCRASVTASADSRCSAGLPRAISSAASSSMDSASTPRCCGSRAGWGTGWPRFPSCGGTTTGARCASYGTRAECCSTWAASASTAGRDATPWGGDARRLRPDRAVSRSDHPGDRTPRPILPPSPRSRGLLVALAGALAIRVLLLRLPRLWYDEATSGLLGLSVLSGELPIYFFGQPFMGALDGYLAAPVFWLFGVSARTLELLPVLLALASVGAHRSAGARRLRGAGRAVRRGAAGAATGLPAVLVSRGSQPLSAHDSPRDTRPAPRALRARRAAGGATLLFALWAAAWGSRSGPTSSRSSISRRSRSCSCGGAWTLVPGVLVALPAFLLGSLPHWLYGVPHGTAMPPPGRPVGARDRARPTSASSAGRPGRSWPACRSAVRDAPLGVALALAIGALYLMAALKALRADPAGARTRGGGRPGPGGPRVHQRGHRCGDAVRARPRRQRPALSPAALLGAAAAPRVVPGRARAIGGARILAARAPPGPRARRARWKLRAISTRPSRRPSAPSSPRSARPWKASSAAAFTGCTIPTPRAGCSRSSRAAGRSSRIPTRRFDRLRARRRRRARRPRWWMPRRAPALEAHFAGARRALRVPSRERARRRLRELRAGRARRPRVPAAVPGHRKRRTGRHRAHDGPQRRRPCEHRPAAAGRRMGPGGSRAPSCRSRSSGGCPARTRRCHAAFVWRLARPVRVAHARGPPGVRRTALLVGGPALLRVRSGRVELRVPPTPARYLRITQTGRGAVWAWTIRELYVYAATGSDPRLRPSRTVATLARAVRSAGRPATLRRPRLGEPRRPSPMPRSACRPPTFSWTTTGSRGRPAMLHRRPFDWAPGTGVLARARRCRGFADAARAGGLSFSRHAVEADSRCSSTPRRPHRAPRVPASVHQGDRVPESEARGPGGGRGSGDALGHGGPAREPATGSASTSPRPGRFAAFGSKRPTRPTTPSGLVVEGSRRRRALGAAAGDPPAGAPVSMGRRSASSTTASSRSRLEFPPATREGACAWCCRRATRSSTGRSTSSRVYGE